jgi:fructose-1,6-bisphosphatase I
MTTTSSQRITLTRYLNNMVKEQPELRDLVSLLLSIQMACKTISNLVNRAGLVCWPPRHQTTIPKDSLEDGRYYSMKRLDQLSTEVLKNALQFTGKLNMVSPVVVQPNTKQEFVDEQPAEHQPGVLIATAYDSNYVACLDPLDGSGNADAAICTGTVFGVFDSTLGEGQGAGAGGVLQPAKNMRAAGYCLYSSATVLVFTLGNGTNVQGFTLDPSLKEFVLTHANLTIPARGTVYSCNEANSEGWSDDFKAYLLSLKKGAENETTGVRGRRARYAHRYVGSMVGDIHRTLLYGGIFCYPSDTDLHPHGNLQLLYKSAPMAFIVNQAGGKSIDEKGGDLLHVQPKRIHQKSPCFIGSPENVDELKNYLVK